MKVSDGPQSIKDQDGDLWSEWADACNGTLYRFLAAAEASDAFGSSITTSGTPQTRERLAQEKALFTFFACALSSLECVAYGVCAIGAFLQPAAFPVQAKPHKMTFRFAAQTFASQFPSDQLGPVLRTADRSSELKALRATRNLLAHRSAPGRTVPLELATTVSGTGTSSRGPARWLGDTLSAQTTDQPRVWLARTLDEILEATEQIVNLHF
jgi:hypothetical protein